VVKVLGGDPFERFDMSELVGCIRDEVRPQILQLNTTGVHTGDIVNTVTRHAWPGLHLRIALDGMEERHDAERGEGAYEAMRRTVERLVLIRRHHPFSLGLNFHLTDATLPDLEAATRWAEELDVGLHVGIPVKPLLFGGAASGAPSVSPETHEALRLHTERVDRHSGYGPISRSFIQHTHLSHQQGSDGNDWPRFRCQELAALVYMLPDGSVVSCGMRPVPVGNLVHQSIEEIWRGAPAAHAREVVAACGGCPQASVMITSRLYGGMIPRLRRALRGRRGQAPPTGASAG
jgi:MoaA/NifB/PqqE/SkfB family radical SAM enzyme